MKEDTPKRKRSELNPVFFRPKDIPEKREKNIKTHHENDEIICLPISNVRSRQESNISSANNHDESIASKLKKHTYWSCRVSRFIHHSNNPNRHIYSHAIGRSKQNEEKEDLKMAYPETVR